MHFYVNIISSFTLFYFHIKGKTYLYLYGVESNLNLGVEPNSISQHYPMIKISPRWSRVAVLGKTAF